MISDQQNKTNKQKNVSNNQPTELTWKSKIFILIWWSEENDAENEETKNKHQKNDDSLSTD